MTPRAHHRGMGSIDVGVMSSDELCAALVSHAAWETAGLAAVLGVLAEFDRRRVWADLLPARDRTESRGGRGSGGPDFALGSPAKNLRECRVGLVRALRDLTPMRHSKNVIVLPRPASSERHRRGSAILVAMIALAGLVKIGRAHV